MNINRWEVKYGDPPVYITRREDVTASEKKHAGITVARLIELKSKEFIVL